MNKHNSRTLNKIELNLQIILVLLPQFILILCRDLPPHLQEVVFVSLGHLIPGLEGVPHILIRADTEVSVGSNELEVRHHVLVPETHLLVLAIQLFVRGTTAHVALQHP